MGYRFNNLPKEIRRLVTLLADIGRKEIAEMRAGDGPDTVERMAALFERGDRVISELLASTFAEEEFGIYYLEGELDKDDVQEMGEYFLGLYALDRLAAEENSEKCPEDLFYAGALLVQRAEIIEDMEEESGFDYEDDEDFLADFLESIDDDDPEIFPGNPEGDSGSNVIPLFGDRKGKKK